MEWKDPTKILPEKNCKMRIRLESGDVVEKGHYYADEKMFQYAFGHYYLAEKKDNFKEYDSSYEKFTGDRVVGYIITPPEEK